MGIREAPFSVPLARLAFSVDKSRVDIQPAAMAWGHDSLAGFKALPSHQKHGLEGAGIPSGTLLPPPARLNAKANQAEHLQPWLGVISLGTEVR